MIRLSDKLAPDDITCPGVKFQLLYGHIVIAFRPPMGSDVQGLLKLVDIVLIDFPVPNPNGVDDIVLN